MKLITLILFFAIYSFTGWIIEVIYRSYTRKKFINPGFLYGPFVPVYGIGGLFMIFLQQFISPLHIALQFIIYTVVLAAIELATGEIFERVFGLQLWDYSDTKFNFKGKISLSFSLAWGVLATGFSYIVHPFLSMYVYKLSFSASTIAASVFSAYFIVDTASSVISLNRFRRDLAYLYEKYSSLNSAEVQKIIRSFKRILDAFPHLNKRLNINLSENIRHKVNTMKGKLSETIETVLSERKPAEQEYINIVSDILEHSEFLKLKNFFHHNSSIYDHAKIVSYVSYRICKYLNLDYKSAARGGLLHDFFLYDWRNHHEPELAKEKFHGLEHPKIALENSLMYFKLNPVEKDIIVKHMWPLTFIPPKYQESFVVTFADKYISSKEFIEEFARNAKKKKETIKEIKAKAAGTAKLLILRKIPLKHISEITGLTLDEIRKLKR